MRLSVVFLVLALPVGALAQGVGKDSAHTAFEVVSVRPSSPDKSVFAVSVPSGSRMTETGIPLDMLIQLSFGIEQRNLQTPEWAKSAQYDIEAKTEGGVSLTREEMQPLMQRLLVDRFGLKYHFETKEVPGYALVVAKGGPKLQLSKEQKMGPGTILGNGVQLPSATMQSLAAVLAVPLGQKPVVDKTGLTGFYEVKLSYAPEGDSESTLPSVFTAVQEQLGLRLEAQKVTVHILVVDHLEQAPTEN